MPLVVESAGAPPHIIMNNEYRAHSLQEYDYRSSVSCEVFLCSQCSGWQRILVIIFLSIENLFLEYSFWNFDFWRFPKREHQNS